MKDESEKEKEKTLKSDSFFDAKKKSSKHSQSNQESLMRSKLPGSTSGHQQGC